MTQASLSIPTSLNFAPPIDDPQRQKEQQLRDSFWDGTWEETLKQDMKKMLSADRVEAIGVIDMSCCLGPQMSAELAVCYIQAPEVTRSGRSPRLTEPGGPVEAALLWSMMPDFQGRVLWVREYPLRLDITADGSLIYRPVQPWLVEIEPDPARPDQPIVWREWVPRCVDGKDQWTRDIIDLKDPENPVLQVLAEDGVTDLTALVFGEDRSGESYPYRWADGRPWMPVELYHRDPDASLWHYSKGVESVSATRGAAVQWTMFTHAYRDAAWEQRVLIDGVVLGVTPKGVSGVRYLSPDPTMIMMIDSVDGKQAQLGQWRIGADPATLLAGLQGYIAQAATREGVSPAELQRLSGDPQSGYAIALTNDGKRQAQRRFGPQFQIRDESLLCKSAALWNRWHTDDEGKPTAKHYPEDGYQVAYRSIPLSPDEELAIRDQVDWELSRGWITSAQALARVRSISVTEAKQIIIANQADEAEIVPPAGGEE